jgi:hypothetical protein
MSIPEYEQQPNPAPGASYDPVSYDPAQAYDPSTGAPTGAVPPPPPGYGGYGPGFVPAPGMPHVPNPALAGLLGFIPGVGAMYNGQFAKGIAHIAIFAIFASLSNHVNGIFGLFVAGWVFYMAFEAYQTARARREGMPLPDPFGLNNIGERFGFHPQQHPDLNQFWDQTVGKMPGAAPIHKEWNVGADGSANYSRTDASGAKTTYEVDPEGNVSSSKTAGAGYPPPSGYPPPPPPAWGAPPSYGAPPAYGAPPVAPPAWGTPPPAYGMPPMMPPVPRSGLPTGALWLIGLGFFALLGSLHSFAFLEGEATGGLFLMALAAFMFFRRQGALGGMYSAGTPGAQFIWVRAMRGAGVVFIVGLLTLLQGLHVVRWESSWPILLIFLGVFILVERSAANRMTATPYPMGYPPVPVAEPVESVVETSSETSIVPKYTRPSNDLGNEEGR